MVAAEEETMAVGREAVVVISLGFVEPSSALFLGMGGSVVMVASVVMADGGTVIALLLLWAEEAQSLRLLWK